MQRVYVGVDLGSSNFHQVAINQGGATTLNREFVTSGANLVKAFSGWRGEIQRDFPIGNVLDPGEGRRGLRQTARTGKKH